MLERLLLAITVTFLAYLSVGSKGYHPTSISSVVEMPATTVASCETLALKDN